MKQRVRYGEISTPDLRRDGRFHTKRRAARVMRVTRRVMKNNPLKQLFK